MIKFPSYNMEMYSVVTLKKKIMTNTYLYS